MAFDKSMHMVAFSRIEKKNDHTRIMRKLQFRGSFKTKNIYHKPIIK